MKKKKIYWKVLRKTNGTLKSCIAPGKHELTYTPGRWTRPKLKNSKLFIFVNKDEALSFAMWFDLTVVRSCEAMGVGKPRRVGIPFGNLDFLFGRFWAGRQRATHQGILYDLLANNIPMGTLWADAVKILPERRSR